MKITNRMRLPNSLVKACTIERHNKPGELSATTLLKGVKEILLTERHYDEITDDVADRVWAIFGTAVHALLEHEEEESFAEEFLESRVEDIKITGRVDHYHMGTGTIDDYKTASTWKVIYQDFDDWKRQGLIYAWLARKNGLTVNRCRFIAMLKDHSKTKAQRDSTYPQSPVYVYEFGVTDEDVKNIEEYIIAKVKGYNEVVEHCDDDIPACTQKERWAKDDKWAVMKEGRKSAIRVCDTEQQAEEIAAEAKGGYVDYRPGENTKCNSYCLVKDFCHFYKESAK